MVRYLQEKPDGMNRWISIMAAMLLLLSGDGALAHIGVAPESMEQVPKGYDVFVPISKYISQGDAAKLSAWFADNLEISVLSSRTSDSSRNQARQIMKNFFDTYTPRSFEFEHMASRGNMKYGLGRLYAGGETFAVTIFVTEKDDSYVIQQLKIERNDALY